MGPEDEAIIREALDEARAAIMADLKNSLYSALREDLPVELQKALEPVMDLLQELRSASRGGLRSSHSIQMTGKLQERQESKAPARDSSGSFDISDVPRVAQAAQMLRRVSAPLNAARAAISANRATQRLKRGFISPENSEEVPSADEGSSPVRRIKPALSVGGTRPLQVQVQPQVQAAAGTGSRIPTFLRLDGDSERIQSHEVTESLDPIFTVSPEFRDSGSAEASPTAAPKAKASPVLAAIQSPGVPSPSPPSEGDGEGLPSPQVQADSSSSSLGEDEEEEDVSLPDVQETVRTERRSSAVRAMNSLEILPQVFLSPTERRTLTATPWQRAIRSLSRWIPRPGRSKTDPTPVEVGPPRRSLRSRGGSSHVLEVFKGKGRPNRRSAVILQASEMQQLSRKAAWWQLGIGSCSWPFADPSARPRQCWDFLGCSLLVLQLLYLPFQAAFITDEDYQDPAYLSLDLALLAVDLFWAIDLALNFTTGYRDAMQVLHTDFCSIAKHYLQSWFFLDLLATVPSLILHFLLVEWLDKRQFDLWPLRWLGLSPVLRSARLWVAFNMLRRMEANLKSSLLSSVAALVELFMLPVIFSHVSACALWSLGRSNLESDSTTSSWIKLGLDIADHPGALQAVPLGERYMTAMYFAVTVMSTVGLGDINMNLSNERALLCVIMATTSLVVGVAVNGVATIVTKLSERTAVTNEQLAKVSRFLRVYKVPGDLQSRVHTYLLQFFENQEREETKSHLMMWLKKSEVLRVNVNLALTGTCLTQHRLLQLVPREVLVNICDICDMEFHPPGQELIPEGVEVRNCFYIRSGLVQTCVRGAAAAKEPQDFSPGATANPFTGDGDEIEEDEIRKEIEVADAARPDEKLHGGAFIGDFRLFLGTSRSWKTVTCVSFCELISIDVEKFRSLMGFQQPELFDVLVIYCAIDNHCPKALLRCLEEQGLSAEVPLLFGEGVLHHCAKMNAAACATYMIEQLGADVSVLDQEEKTPAQVAAKLKHKETFWAVIRHGSIVTDADVLPKEAHSVRSKKGRRVQIAGSAVSFTSEDEDFSLNTLVEVRELLVSCGIDVGFYGHDCHKSLDDLVSELNTCKSELVVLPGKRLRRRVKLVRLRLLSILDGAVRALVEVQSDAWLRAPDQKLGKLPCRRLLRDQTEEEATKDLMLDVGIPEQVLQEKLLVPVAKSMHVEHKVSMSFPGLETDYVVYESSWKVRAQALHKAAEIGLPEGKAFSKELRLSAFRTVSRQFFWPVLLNIHLDASHAEQTRTEDLRVRFHSAREEEAAGLARFNPLRALRGGRVIEVGARQG